MSKASRTFESSFVFNKRTTITKNKQLLANNQAQFSSTQYLQLFAYAINISQSVIIVLLVFAYDIVPKTKKI